VLVGEMIAVALQSVRANLFRAILTMLGIIIGVASVITMVALGSGAQQAVDRQIEALGAGVLSIRSGQTFSQGVAQTRDTLTIADAAALRQDATTILAVVPERSGMEQAKLANQNRNLRIIGTTHEFAELHDYQLEAGQVFTARDNSAKRSLAVLGSKVPAMFNETAQSIVGKTIYLRGIAFVVSGVFREKGLTGWRNVDEQVWIPLDTARYRIFGSENLDLISAKAAPGVSMQQAIVDIERVLRREHRIPPGQDNDFSIQDPRQFLDFQQAAASIFAYLLAGIASVSLIVGGIGIMNIMLVTVTERTREIGIRKALGATRFNIMVQFVVEAMILCLIGGALGVLLGMTIAALLNSIAGWQAQVSAAAVMLAFAFSAGVGLFFGLWPARKAARMDPIAALRYE
jgi:putative ABC transport system permease protein